jgi:nitroreductase/NAD-dependent dihydropyrimidine dehydrogenase PreA subunit
MEIIQVNQETCTQCGICAAVCPGGLIDFKTGGYPQPTPPAELVCVRCGHCVAVCQPGSLTHREMPVEQCPPLTEGLQITAEQCENWLKSRRSIRVYRDKPVPRDVIVRLIETARYAPSGHNVQDVEWLVIGNREQLLRLEDIGMDWLHWTRENQPQMALTLDMERILEHEEKAKNVFLRDAPVLIVAHAAKGSPMSLINCTIALTYLELAARGMGLGCCWAGFIYFMANSFPPMKEALALPDGHNACGCMMLGYPRYSYHRLPLRKQPSITWQQLRNSR